MCTREIPTPPEVFTNEGDIEEVIDIMRGPIEVNPNVSIRFREGAIRLINPKEVDIAEAVRYLKGNYNPSPYEVGRKYSDFPAFLINKGTITQDILSRIAELPFEVEIFGVKATGEYAGQVLLVAGLDHRAPGIPNNADIIDKNGRIISLSNREEALMNNPILSFYLHSHPVHVRDDGQEIALAYPSSGDLFVNFGPLNYYILSIFGIVRYKPGEHLPKADGDFRVLLETTAEKYGFSVVLPAPDLLYLGNDELDIKRRYGWMKVILNKIGAIVEEYPFNNLNG